MLQPASEAEADTAPVAARHEAFHLGIPHAGFFFYPRVEAKRDTEWNKKQIPRLRGELSREGPVHVECSGVVPASIFRAPQASRTSGAVPIGIP